MLVACTNEPKRDLTHLEGYWEIEGVQTPDGQQKEFSVNTLIDYIALKDGSGSRSKVQTQLDGSFISQPTTETFKMKDSAGSWYLFYTTPYDSWIERLEFLEKDKLILRIPDGNTYTYRRFQPININP